jgi:hypothetical protein
MNRIWKPLLAIVSLFALGAVSGIAADRFHHRGTPQQILLQRVHDDPVGEIERRITLRPEQRAQISAILAKRQGAIDAVWSDTHIRLQATVDSVVSEIAAVLDPDQAEKFRAVARELHGGPPRGLHR